MLNVDKPVTAGFDGHLHLRAPSDLLPRIHAHARRRGMTGASWVRAVIIAALDQAAPDHRDAAA